MTTPASISKFPCHQTQLASLGSSGANPLSKPSAPLPALAAHPLCRRSQVWPLLATIAILGCEPSSAPKGADPTGAACASDAAHQRAAPATGPTESECVRSGLIELGKAWPRLEATEDGLTYNLVFSTDSPPLQSDAGGRLVRVHGLCYQRTFPAEPTSAAMSQRPAPDTTLWFIRVDRWDRLD